MEGAVITLTMDITVDYAILEVANKGVYLHNSPRLDTTYVSRSLLLTRARASICTGDRSWSFDERTKHTGRTTVRRPSGERKAVVVRAAVGGFW